MSIRLALPCRRRAIACLVGFAPQSLSLKVDDLLTGAQFTPCGLSLETIA